MRLQKFDEIGAVLFLLEPREDHLGALDVPLGVEQVFKEGLVAPDDTRVLVGGRVRKAIDRAGLTAEQAPQVGALLGAAALVVCTREQIGGGELKQVSQCDRVWIGREEGIGAGTYMCDIGSTLS